MQTLWQIETHDETETQALAARLAGRCRGGELIALDGPMGAGKTCFAGGFARGLGIEGAILSPTFVLMRNYAGSRGLTLYHLDFYRLGGDEDLDTIGFEDCSRSDSVVLVEWPSRCPAAMAESALVIQIEPLDDSRRRVRALAAPDMAERFAEVPLVCAKREAR